MSQLSKVYWLDVPVSNVWLSKSHLLLVPQKSIRGELILSFYFLHFSKLLCIEKSVLIHQKSCANSPWVWAKWNAMYVTMICLIKKVLKYGTSFQPRWGHWLAVWLLANHSIPWVSLSGPQDVAHRTNSQGWKEYLKHRRCSINTSWKWTKINQQWLQKY